MFRMAEFFNRYHLDIITSEPIMNVITASIIFAIKGSGF